MKEIILRLAKIQAELKAPKGQVNSFGNYKYRSCEDILEAVKPLLGDAVITINDEIVMIGDRFYVKSTATLTDETGSISNSAYARESLEKKGMDSAQVTGATSSYARKYALNGLLLIDDTKDADTMDNRVQTPSVSPKTAPVKDESQLCPIHNLTIQKRISNSTGKAYWLCNGDPKKTHFLDDPNKSHADEDINY